MLLGTTFSPHHLQNLDLSVESTFSDLLSLKLDLIRLGCYWNETELEPGVYDFSQLESLLELCEEHHQKVILTLGMKSPRWPEYYFPEWLEAKDPHHQKTQDACLAFLVASIDGLNRFTCITHFQVENEPLDPSGPSNAVIPIEFLIKEIELVKELTKQPVVINFWGNAFSLRGVYKLVMPYLDILGLDLYYAQFVKKIFGRSLYTGPLDSDPRLKRISNTLNKPIWITELQAEPWEQATIAYDHPNPKSISPEKIIENFNRAKLLSPEVILLWGYEYWYYRKEVFGDLRFWETVCELKSKNSSLFNQDS